MRDNLAYAHWDKWLTEDGGHHPNPAPVPCESCDNALVEGGKTICKACGYGELESLVFQMERYLKDLHRRGMTIPDSTAQDGTMIGGIEVALKLFVRPMVSICKEVGSNV